MNEWVKAAHGALKYSSGNTDIKNPMLKNHCMMILSSEWMMNVLKSFNFPILSGFQLYWGIMVNLTLYIYLDFFFRKF